MKKITKVLLILYCFSIFVFDVRADNIVKSINITAQLEKDGTMHVTEIWNMNTDEGTEVFKEELNLGQMKITNFKVRDTNKEYTELSLWNVNGSFNDKKYKYGINYVSNGIELCWGISKYGNNTYTITYDIENVIFNVNDAQVLEKRLINTLNTPAKSFSVVISGPYFYPNTLDVWGFGYKGYAYVENGKIYMQSEENTTLNSSDYATLLVKFPLNTFTIDNNSRQNGMNTFDDVLDDAYNNTYKYDYNIEDDFSIDPVFIFASIAIVIGVVRALSSKYKFGKLGKKIKMSEINMYRDIPCDKNLYKAYFIAQAYRLNKKNTDLFGAIFLKWLDEGKISIIKDSKKTLLGSKELTNIQLQENLSFEVECEKEFYNYIYTASKDGVLEEKEFEKYAKNNYNKILKWFDKAEEYGRDLYASNNLVTKVGLKYRVDDALKAEAIKLAGLKKYLKEFSSIDKKQPIEVKLWKEYLIYAQIFGMADEVAKTFEKLYPEVIEEMKNYNYDVTDVIILNRISRTAVNNISAARTAAQNYNAGGGGFSVGGGGGSFGGGGGGGTR